MSRVLKAGDPAVMRAVSPLGISHLRPSLQKPEAASFVREESATDSAQFEQERVELETAIAELQQRLTDTENEADIREDAAFERGRSAGEILATGEREKRLTILRDALSSLTQAQQIQLAGCELLALQLARTALGRVFGDENLRTELVQRTIANQLTSIRRELVLSLKVSPQDYGTEDGLASLQAGFPGLKIILDELLEAGVCILDLQLGEIDLGIPGQWQRLSRFLDGLAGGEEES